jgi:DNA/RNA-binding domain of Phe-tRNA-synthetase-like protein
MDIEIRLGDEDFMAGIMIARGVRVEPTPPELASQLDALIAKRATEEFPPPHVKEAVRDMLRKGGFKPSGRNKPSSEYLAQAAREGRFPRINNLVDVNNLLSLQSGLPMSLLDATAVGDRIEMRYGSEGEKYVFNPAGQEIDLKGLICVCRKDDSGSVPLGNAIKDSMTGKLKDSTRDVMGIVYATRGAIDPSGLDELVGEFGELLTRFGGAESIEQSVLSPSM